MNKYIQTKQEELFNELGVFFAFGDKQFEEQRKKDVEYCTVLGAGDCVPVLHSDEFVKRLSEIHTEGHKRNLEEKGIDRIIEDELNNVEAFYTGGIEDAMHSLSAYNVSEEKVWEIYNKVAHKYYDA